MGLSAGTRLGVYEITGILGAGGMGEVYRARDTKLNRQVAIKVLPDGLGEDAERLARFAQEAQTLAALNHPNIAQIYGLEGNALVMELVEGEDLSAHIARGPIPLAEALPIARQIADALEAAHELGIVHRDLKPANVKVRADGTVKVLDFGLAKAMVQTSTSGSDIANSPTLTARGTQMGIILGTAAYMAPEQARGKPVDRRADIWAFGVVLFEMLTGRRTFSGDEVSDVLASVLKTDPEWTKLPIDVPASVRRLLRRCLEKDPRKRLSAIGDARLELDEIEIERSTTQPGASPATPARRSIAAWLWPAVAGVVMTAAIAWLLWPAAEQASSAGATRLSILPPPGTNVYPDSAEIALSPDGTMVAFTVGATGSAGTVTQAATQLWVRSLDSTSSRRLEAGDGATLPFWSPDSRRIGFFTKTQLKTIAVSGGRAEVLADAPGPRGGTWNASNTIVFAPDAGGPLYRIPASGGTPEPVTTIDPERKEFGHRFPMFLPDGDHFLYAALPGKNGKFDIFVGSLKDHSRTSIGPMESAPAYADPGWLLFARQGVLAAQQFDVRALKVIGDPVSLADEPATILDPSISFTAGRLVSVSRTGSLAYYSASSTNTKLVWYDAKGAQTGVLNVPPAHYQSAAISPDGTNAVLVRSTSPSDSSLWLVDLARGSVSPLSSGRGRNDAPVWSPDGARVVFAADRDGPQNLFVKTIGDAEPERSLYQSDVMFKAPAAWSPDKQWIVTTQLDAGTAHNVWRLAASGSPDPKVLVRGPVRDNAGPISPDGRWISFASEDSGRFELFIQPFPEPGRRIQVSQQGASFAWWTRDNRQIVYLNDELNSLWRVDVQLGDAPRVGTPVQIAKLPSHIVSMDAMPDRQRFLAVTAEHVEGGSITIVHSWRAALK